MALVLTRKERGKMIAEKPHRVLRFDDWLYKVASQAGHGFYNVTRSQAFGAEWICACPDFTYRQVKCKHIWAVELSSKLRHVVKSRQVIPVVDIHSCLYCKSENLIKWGIRRNKYGDIQKFSCKSCGKFFTVNLGFEHMKHSPQAITTAMQLYFSGSSLRNVAKSLKLLGVQVSHKTVFYWIKKYTELMQEYLSQITPQVSDTWRADEIYVKMRGNAKWLFAVMDDETRFWIAQEVADTQYTHDARKLLQIARAVAGKKPKTFITDGLHVYQDAYTKEYWTRDTEGRTLHIRNITFKGEHNNNKMERLNGEIRDREKVMRSLKKEDTPILTGYQLFHNYIRPHQGLDGRTPAELCGIQVEGENKWLTLIQNASESHLLSKPVSSSKRP
jgi:putative transposase